MNGLSIKKSQGLDGSDGKAKIWPLLMSFFIIFLIVLFLMGNNMKMLFDTSSLVETESGQKIRNLFMRLQESDLPNQYWYRNIFFLLLFDLWRKKILYIFYKKILIYQRTCGYDWLGVWLRLIAFGWEGKQILEWPTNQPKWGWQVGSHKGLSSMQNFAHLRWRFIVWTLQPLKFKILLH